MVRVLRSILPLDKPQITPAPSGVKLSKLPPLPKPPAGDWRYSNGHILVNGEDVAKVVNQLADKSPAELSHFARELAAYQNYTFYTKWAKRRRRLGKKHRDPDNIDPTGELSHIMALVDAYVAKISRILKRRYDEKTDGITFKLDEEGQLILNGMNVTSFIEMTRQYPSKKAQVFLRGLKNRLALMVANKSRSPAYEKIRETTVSLFHQIDDELKRIVEEERLLENS